MIFLQILLAVLAVSLVSLVGVLTLGLKFDQKKVTFYLISLVSGTMLGGALLHLIPETLEQKSPHAFLYISIGVFFFFVMEKLLLWRHCHHHHTPSDHVRPVAANMILVGDTIHNFIDGLIIASAFMTNVSVGLSVTVAIMLHEIPQELGDFAMLLHGGYSVKRALVFNFLSALASVVGAVIAYFAIGLVGPLRLAILPIAAGGFLYIALADLIPQLHEQTSPRKTIEQILLLAAGFGLMYFL